MKQAIDTSFKCPACGKNLVVDDGGAGMEVNCPVCNEKILIPRGVQALDIRLPGSSLACWGYALQARAAAAQLAPVGRHMRAL